MIESGASALSGYRVLDLCGPRGAYCGKLLADLGAEVIKVEPPVGDKARSVPPFKGDDPHPEKSLYFASFNTNKKSVVLDLTDANDRSIFGKLVQTSDAVVEDFQPGFLSSLQLDYPELKQLNPGLVLASITGFGQSGLYRGFVSEDIVAFAMSGMMNISGSPTRPPAVGPWQQANHVGSIHAAFGILVALYNRMQTGLGQRVDVSQQEALACKMQEVVRYSLTSEISRRRGNQLGVLNANFPCKDGFVSLIIIPVDHWKALVEWMGSPEELSGPELLNRDGRRAKQDVIVEHLKKFFATRTMEDLTREGQARHITIELREHG